MSALFDLTGKVACVTGASSGIGRAIAGAFAGQGAAVVCLARRADALAETVTAIEAAVGRAAAVTGDLGMLAAIPDVAAAVAKPFGDVDILVNAAGVNLREHADAVSPEGWQKTIDLNLSAPFFLAQGLVGPMKQRGWGRIINIASLQTERAFANGIAYGTSKAGIGQLTRAMAEAWSRDGITCNAIAPGFFPTELTAPVFADDGLAAANAAQTCIGRNGRLQDLAGPAVFLASDASAYVTGQVLYVDGGFTAK